MASITEILECLSARPSRRQRKIGFPLFLMGLPFFPLELQDY